MNTQKPSLIGGHVSRPLSGGGKEPWEYWGRGIPGGGNHTCRD